MIKEKDVVKVFNKYCKHCMMYVNDDPNPCMCRPVWDELRRIYSNDGGNSVSEATLLYEILTHLQHNHFKMRRVKPTQKTTKKKRGGKR